MKYKVLTKRKQFLTDNNRIEDKVRQLEYIKSLSYRELLLTYFNNSEAKRIWKESVGYLWDGIKTILSHVLNIVILVTFPISVFLVMMYLANKDKRFAHRALKKLKPGRYD